MARVAKSDGASRAEHAGFLQAICENPDDDTPRLVYADWLEEHGNAERAEFIRTQIDLSRLPEYEPLWQRYRASRRWGLLEGDLRKGLPKLPEGLEWVHLCFHRGFPWKVWVHDLGALLTHARYLFAQAPVQALKDVGRQEFTRLARSPHLKRMRALELSGHHIGERLIDVLSESRYATRITDLNLGPSGISAGGLHRLLRCPLGRRLRRLVVWHTFFSTRGRQFAEAFRGATVPALECLDLSHNQLDEVQWQSMLQSWSLPALRQLELYGSRLGPGGTMTLARFAGLNRLNYLGLGHSKPGVAALRALLDSPHLEGLQGLGLAGNDLGPDAAYALAGCPRLAGLRSLDLRGNPLGGEGLIALVRSPYLKNLGSLQIHETGIGNKGLRALVASPSLENLSHLDLFQCTRQYWAKNGFSKAVRQALRNRFGQRCGLPKRKSATGCKKLIP